MTQIDLQNCSGCCAVPGAEHGEDCGHARCPDCGEQLLFHNCEYWAENADGSDRLAIWHGVDPRAEVARKLTWITTITSIDGLDYLIEDYARVLFAEALGQITWDSRTQRYVIGRIDEAELDRAIADSH